jgi:glycine cleavage system H protein
MNFNGCFFPDNLLYSRDADLWFSPSRRGFVTGISSVVLWTCGKGIRIKVRDASEIVEEGKSLASVESSRYFGTLRLPFSARIVEVNKSLGKSDISSASIYENDWIAVVEPVSSERALKSLLAADRAADIIARKVSELRLTCFSDLPDTEMIEIGSECNAVLSRVNQELEGKKPGFILHLVTDDPTSPIEMVRWSDETGNRIVEKRKIENIFHFILEKQ